MDVVNRLLVGAAVWALLVAGPVLALNAAAQDQPNAVSNVAPAAGISVDEMPDVMRGAYILSIQEALKAHGYHVGPIDGVVGSKTKGAIRQYQRDAGLPVDGVPTKELLDHLYFAQPKVMARRATSAESSRLVLDIQTELQKRGYYQGRLDGLIGPATRAAIEAFQADAGLPVDGNLGSGILADLQAADPTIKRY